MGMRSFSLRFFTLVGAAPPFLVLATPAWSAEVTPGLAPRPRPILEQPGREPGKEQPRPTGPNQNGNATAPPLSERPRTGLAARPTPAAAPTAAPAPAATTGGKFTEDLKLDSSGEQVTLLQQTLRSLGYFTHPADTGYFGSATEEAVKKLQTAKGLPVTGQVGPKTRAVLNAY